MSSRTRFPDIMTRSSRLPPGPDGRPAKPLDARGTFRRVVAIFKPYRKPILLLAITIVVTSGLGIVNPLLIKQVFDKALFGLHDTCSGRPCPNRPLLYRYVALGIAIPMVTSLIGIGQTYLSNAVGLQLMRDLRDRLYAHLQSMALRFFTSTRTGEIQSRLTNDVGGVQTVVTDTASSILSNVVIIVSSLVAMALLSWKLTILSLALVPLFVFLTYRVGKIRKAVQSIAQQSLADLTAITEETLSVSGILLSKVFGRQRHEIGRFRDENQRLTDVQLRQRMIGRSFFAVVGTFFSITPFLVYLVAGLVGFKGRGQLTPGAIVAFTTLQARLFFPIGQMLSVSTDVQSSMALFERIFEYMDMPAEIQDAPDAIRLSPKLVRGEVRFRDVWFRYEAPRQSAAQPAGGRAPPPRGSTEGANGHEPAREWTLEGVNLEVRPGQLAALVGPSGAGKTTTTYLVPRLYDVQRGSVEIDGFDVRRISLESLGELMGVVTQETYLFHTTVRRNLQQGKLDSTDAELEAACRAAFIHDRIMELPEGYDTVVGERGYKLSGGEKQRLAIARVILKDPRILILDEATSSLDTTSERLVQEALRPLMRGRTTIAIAHRLSTILSADVIFVIDRGRVVEQGTHAELVRRGGLYSELYEQQFAGSAVEAEWEEGLALPAGAVVDERPVAALAPPPQRQVRRLPPHWREESSNGDTQPPGGGARPGVEPRPADVRPRRAAPAAAADPPALASARVDELVPTETRPSRALPRLPRRALLAHHAPAGPWIRLDWALLAGVTVLGALLRLVRLTYPHGIMFDESYYARDACLYLGHSPAFCGAPGAGEQSYMHPPLGKWIIAAGIKVFGYNPFGWRVMAALFGTALVALVFVLGRKLLGRWAGAIAGFLVATDFLLIVQSRIAMLDIFLVFFVVLGFLFVAYEHERILAVRQQGGGELDLRWRVAAGLAFGAAAAVKWSGIYALVAGGALVALWAVESAAHLRLVKAGLPEHAAPYAPSPELEFNATVLAIGIPALVVYLASYGAWYAHHGFSMAQLLSLQHSMLDYHMHLSIRHAYATRAWTWPLVIRPIAYFYSPANIHEHQILAFGNPATWWAALLAGGWFLVRSFRRRHAPERLVMAGWLAQYLPWLFVARQLFFFYMAPVVPFMMLALAGSLTDLAEGSRRRRTLVIGFLVAVAALVWFYFPVLTGALHGRNL